MKKIYVLVFHPRLESSMVNRFLLNAFLTREDIVVNDMYELYPDFNIDVLKEQQDLLDADLVIIQHPFYWYSAPPLVKQWIDLVLEHGWAYGRGGNKLQDKKILHLISSGGTFETYCNEGKNLFTYIDLLRPFEMTYKLCQMNQLPPYIIPNARNINTKNLEEHFRQIEHVIDKLKLLESTDSISKNINYLNELT